MSGGSYMNPEKFEIGNRIVCIKEYEKLKVGNYYSISGSGSLEFNHHPNARSKKGYGFCIKCEIYNPKKGTGRFTYGGASAIETDFYYFTEKEMDEYFISEDDDYKIYLRDKKIEQIVD